jgi:hypothetical protein
MKLDHQLFRIVILSASIFLAACSKGPMDTPLVMGQGFEQYKVDISSRAEKMSSLELTAFNWAVEGINYERLIEVAPKKTPREVIRMGIANAKADIEQGMAPAEKAITEFEDVRAELQKITPSDIKFRQQKTFFGHMPHLDFNVSNGSRYDVGTMHWVASIRVNEAERVEATKKLSMHYKNSTSLAMKQGKNYSEQYQVGHVSGDYSWTTQTILQANKLDVTVVPDIEAIRDLEGNLILPKSPYPRMEQLNRMSKAVELYGSI